MEEVQCCLLGFQSAMLQQALEAAAPTEAALPHQRETAPASSAAASATLQSYCHSLPFHPTEHALLLRILPLGHTYRRLQMAIIDVAVGRAEGLYPAAIGAGGRKILDHYAAAVKATATPADLAGLAPTYAVAFASLTEIVAAQQTPEVCLPLLDRFLHHHEIPAVLRRFLGESVWVSVLYTTAHYVAHGVVLHARADYFIAVQASAEPPTSPRIGSSGSSKTAEPGQRKEEHTLFVDRLPCGISAELGLRILTAGKERRVLLRDADAQGGSDYLEQLAMGSQDEAANAVFHSIFNVQLCRGGVLASEELAARVEAALALWSKALWMRIGDLATLREHLVALRSVFLCHRGDVWYAFVELVLPVLMESTALQRRDQARAFTAFVSGPSAKEDKATDLEDNEEVKPEDEGVRRRAAAATRCAYLQRAVADAFKAALSVSNLRDVAAFDGFAMRVSSAVVQQADADLASIATAPAVGSTAMVEEEEEEAKQEAKGKGGSRHCRKSRTIPVGSRSGGSGRTASMEDVARHLLQMVQAMHVHFLSPPGLSLIVSTKSMQYYQRLLSFHLALQFSLQTLSMTRSFLSEALVTNRTPSAELKRAFSLFHLLQFLESTLGNHVQVDVISVYTAKLEEELASSACASVEQAKRLHDQYIWGVSEASFLTEGSQALLHACLTLHRCAVTLYILCTRYRVPYWAVEGVNETPIEVRATLSALEARVQQEVVAVFTGHLGLGGRPWERALWGRLDFNKFFSQPRNHPLLGARLQSTGGAGDAASVAAPPTSSSAASPFAQPRKTRSRSTAGGRGANAGRPTRSAAPSK